MALSSQMAAAVKHGLHNVAFATEAEALVEAAALGCGPEDCGIDNLLATKGQGGFEKAASDSAGRPLDARNSKRSRAKAGASAAVAARKTEPDRSEPLGWSMGLHQPSRQLALRRRLPHLGSAVSAYSFRDFRDSCQK